MEKNIEVNEDLLKLIFGSSNVSLPYVPFTCMGASGESKPVQSFLKVVNFAKESSNYPESYVLCPRFRRFYLSGSGSYEFRCVEDKDKDKENASEYSSHEKCPYFHPKSN